MRKLAKRSVALAVVLLLALLATACSGVTVGGVAISEMTEDQKAQAKQNFEQATGVMMNGTFDDLQTMTPVTLKKEDMIDISPQWEEYESYIAEYGQLTKAKFEEAYVYGTDWITTGRLTFENGARELSIKFNKKGQLLDLFFYTPADVDEETYTLPESVEEYDIVLGQDSQYPIEGKLTVPQNAQDMESLPGVVLVGGVGANDMDMSGGNTKAYRDIAWGLAERGIAVLRFNKRVNQYPDTWDLENPIAENMTVDFEIVEDAVKASEYLKGLPYVDGDQVYMLGHTTGGILAPRIDQAGGDFAGYIMLATTSRPWYQAAYDQILNYGLAGLTDAQLRIMISIKSDEKKRIEKKLDTMDEEELLEDTLLGMPAIYWKDMNSMDYTQMLKDEQKPVLFLQGEEDYQIIAEVDFAEWKEVMKDCDFAQFKSYPELNHLFVKSEGCYKGSAKEYDIPNHVPQEVMTDIAAFIAENGK